MNKIELRFYGEPILREMCIAVDIITPEITTIVDEMIKIMKANKAAGLAAPQVGFAKRIITFVNSDGDYCALINPQILSVSEETEKVREGCLSMPNVFARVERPKTAVVRGTVMDTQTADFNMEGIACRAVLHEIDHLDGILFIDKLSKFDRNMIRNKIRLLPRTIKKIKKNNEALRKLEQKT